MHRFLQSSILCFLLLFSLPLGAQTASSPADTAIYYFSPVIVSPTHAIERETPATFSTLNREQIDLRYSVQDIPVMLAEFPSMTYYSENGNGIGYNYINLRGFDQRRLSVMINGVPQNDPEDHNVYWIDFPDLLSSTSTLQVQRGAGTAFYGPPAIGGSINIITNPFTQDPGITLTTMFGFQELADTTISLPLTTRKYEASINSGLIGQQYMLYGKLGKIRSEGYRQHSWADLNSYFLGALRLDRNMSTRIHLFGGPLRDGLAFVGLPRSFNSDPALRRLNFSYWDTTGFFVPQKPQAQENFSQPHYELIHEWRLTPSATLHNTFFFYTGDGHFDYDGDWIPFTPSAVSWFNRFVGYDSTFGDTEFPTFLIRAFVGNRQWGWLPRVELQHTAGRLMLGVEARLHRSVHWGRILFASQLPSPTFDPDFHFYEYNGEKDILSVYAHELYKPAENLTLLADLQLVYNRYAIRNEKFLDNSFSRPYVFLNPRLGLNYNVTDTWNTYLSLGYTSREPRLRNLYAAEDAWFGATPEFEADTIGGTIRYRFDKPIAKPERLFNIELGGGFRTGDIQIAANVYWMEFTDELVRSGQVDIFGQPVTGNAERSRHVGVEIDGSISLGKHWKLMGNFALSHNELVSHTIFQEDGSGTLSPVRLDGNPVAGFPGALGNLRLSYRQDNLAASVVAKYVGPFYTDNFKNEENRNPDYTVFNAEVLYTLPKFWDTVLSLRGEVRNIFNRLYTLSGEGNSFFPAAERNYLVGLTANL